MPSAVDIAFAAGLFEGEGTIRVDRYYYHKGEKRERKTPQLKLRINMTDLEPVLRFVDTFGGRVHGPYFYENTKMRKASWMGDVDSPPLVRLSLQCGRICLHADKNS